MPAPLIAALALLAAPAADPPYNWGTDTTDFTRTPEFAASKATCRRLGAPRPPASDLPSPAQRAALKGCDAEALYYGIGVRPDDVRARQCALTQPPKDETFGGATILMQVYANGLGVKKDLDLATAYACTLHGAAAESQGRVNHLQSLKATPAKARFDVCDDMTSGSGVSACTARDSKLQAVTRDARLAALVARLPPPAKPLYAAMTRDLDAFVKARGNEAFQTGGSMRGGQEITAENVVRDAFLKEFTELMSRRLPAATAAQARAADVALNAAYRKALADSASNPPQFGPPELRAEQRAWLAWRDAYVRFARAAAPDVSSDSVLARLSRDRTAGLDGRDDPDDPENAAHPYDPDKPS